MVGPRRQDGYVPNHVPPPNAEPTKDEAYGKEVFDTHLKVLRVLSYLLVWYVGLRSHAIVYN